MHKRASVKYHKHWAQENMTLRHNADNILHNICFGWWTWLTIIIICFLYWPKSSQDGLTSTLSHTEQSLLIVFHLHGGLCRIELLPISPLHLWVSSKQSPQRAACMGSRKTNRRGLFQPSITDTQYTIHSKKIQMIRGSIINPMGTISPLPILLAVYKMTGK